MSILVFGGSGALGRSLVSHFRSAGVRVLSIDLYANPSASRSLIYNSLAQLKADLKEEPPFDAIFCVAGGWSGGNAVNPELLSQTEAMFNSSVVPATVCAALCPSHLKAGGHLMLVGAAAVADGPTPSMLAYGMAKSSIIHLTRSLAAPSSGMPQGSSILCLLPVTLDTPANRSAMPNADTSSWTPLNSICEFLDNWIHGKNAAVYPNGSLIKVITTHGTTKFTPVQ